VVDPSNTADLVLANSNVLTMDPAKPQGRSLAVRKGKILIVGDTDRLKDLQNYHTTVIDLKGKTILPGFIDAHLHFRALAESLTTISLEPKSGIRSISDINDRIHRQALKLPSGEWIRANGYNEALLAEDRHPNRWDLDKAAPDHPVKLTHRSGRAHVLNSRGLESTGINNETDDPPEGIIDRDLENGDPTGVLWGLGDFLSRRIPSLDEKVLSHGAMLAEHRLLSHGITSFHDASARNNRERWQWFEKLKADGHIRPGVTMMLGLEGLKQHQEKEFQTQIDENSLSLGGVKIIIDETTGALNPSQEELNDIVLAIHRAGRQVILHAIEESAIEAAVKAITRALEMFPRMDHRHRVEHCSVCPPDLTRKLASTGIVVVTHPAFIYYSGDRYLQTVPLTQQKHLYPISSLFKAGVHVAAASDSPIVGTNPLAGIYGAVTRLTESGKGVLVEERILVQKAIRMYTELSAMSSFKDKVRGTITPGKWADFAVLSADPLKVPEEEIKDIKVEMTIIGGEVVWSG